MKVLRWPVLHSLERHGCILCLGTTIDVLEFGELFSTKTIQAHHFCLLLSGNISQTGKDIEGASVFLYTDIIRAVDRSRTKKCYYCHEVGAAIECNRADCKRMFHLPCGVMNNIQIDMNKFKSYCHSHREDSNLPDEIKNAIHNYECLICGESSIDVEKLIWADCCKTEVVLHIACVKRFALNACHFTKCPACHNSEEFLNTIKKYGVFVPNRDASWEFEQYAVGDSLYRHNSCDVAECMCPGGRNYSQNSGKWKLLLCELCGSSGSHDGCTIIENKFVCKTCIAIEGRFNNNNSTAKTTDQNSTNPSVDLEKNKFFAEQLNITAKVADSGYSHKTSSYNYAFDGYDRNNSNSQKRKLSTYVSPHVAEKKMMASSETPTRTSILDVPKKSTEGYGLYGNICPPKTVAGNTNVSDAVPSCSGISYKSTVGAIAQPESNDSQIMDSVSSACARVRARAPVPFKTTSNCTNYGR